jgi:hypothetical protein
MVGGLPRQTAENDNFAAFLVYRSFDEDGIAKTTERL